jgi:hypothetical protein
MIHWCGDETAAVLTTVPMLAFAWRWLRGKFQKRSPK